VVRQAHLTAVAGTFVIGCAVLLLVSCAGTRSETSMGQGPTEATKKDQTRPPEATVSLHRTACFSDLESVEWILTTVAADNPSSNFER
jgi:hypothetical protein